MIDEKKLIEDLVAETYMLYEADRFHGCTDYTPIDAIDRVGLMQVINKQPKISEWIPCNERMPEVEQDVLLSFRSLDVRVGYRSNNEGFFYVYGEEYVSFENTLAWQPLPEPYKAQDN